MARKILNRKELRDEHDAAKRLGGEAEPTTEKKEKTPKKETKRKSRSKAAKEVRLKAFWGVFDQTLAKPIALFDYSQRPDAVKKAEELSESKKSPHFVQIVKRVIEG